MKFFCSMLRGWRVVMPAVLLLGLGLLVSPGNCGFGGVEEAQDSSMSRDELVVELNLESESLTAKMVTKYRGDQARYDIPESDLGSISAITNLKKGEIYYLYHGTKTTTTSSMEAQKKSVNEQLKQAGVDLSKMAQPKATGKKERIGKWDTEIFETMAGKETVRLWVAKDFPNYRRVRACLEKFERDGSFDPHKFDLPGLVVKSVYDLPPTGETTVTLLEVRYESVQPKEFTVPQDYVDAGAEE